MWYLPGFFDHGAYFVLVRISILVIPDHSMGNAILLYFIDKEVPQ